MTFDLGEDVFLDTNTIQLFRTIQLVSVLIYWLQEVLILVETWKHEAYI